MSIGAVGSVGSFTPSGRLVEVVAKTPVGEDKDGNRNIRVTYRTLEPEGIEAAAAKPLAADRNGPNPNRSEERSSRRGQQGSPQDPAPQDLATQDLAPAERARLDQLRGRDAQVRAEETAHTANAGDLAGPIQYVYQRGPDGRLYAIGGSVGVSARASSDSPEELRRIGQRLTAAALAAINPSGADQSVARSGDVFRAYGQAEAFGGGARGDEARDSRRVSFDV